MHFEQSAILTVHNHVITRNPRISVTHDKHDRHRTWYLHINNVQEEDKGRYMCQINTVTAKTQFGYLNVVGECETIKSKKLCKKLYETAHATFCGKNKNQKINKNENENENENFRQTALKVLTYGKTS